MREKCTPGQIQAVLIIIISEMCGVTYKRQERKNAEAKEDYNDMLLIVLKQCVYI